MEWANPEKIQTGGGGGGGGCVKDMEFPEVSEKYHVEFPGVN